MVPSKYWITGLYGAWIRQVNNGWAEKIEVRDVLGGPGLAAVSSGGICTELIGPGDAWHALEKRDFCVTVQNKYDVAHALCQAVLDRFIEAIGRGNERIDLDSMLAAAANQFVLLRESIEPA